MPTSSRQVCFLLGHGRAATAMPAHVPWPRLTPTADPLAMLVPPAESEEVAALQDDLKEKVAELEVGGRVGWYLAGCI